MRRVGCAQVLEEVGASPLAIVFDGADHAGAVVEGILVRFLLMRDNVWHVTQRVIRVAMLSTSFNTDTLTGQLFDDVTGRLKLNGAAGRERVWSMVHDSASVCGAAVNGLVNMFPRALSFKCVPHRLACAGTKHQCTQATIVLECAHACFSVPNVRTRFSVFCEDKKVSGVTAPRFDAARWSSVVDATETLVNHWQLFREFFLQVCGCRSSCHGRG